MDVYLSQNKRDRTGSTLVFSSPDGGIWHHRVTLKEAGEYEQGKFCRLPVEAKVIREPDKSPRIDEARPVIEMADEELEELTAPDEEG